MPGIGASLQEKAAQLSALVAKVSAWVIGPASGPGSIVDFGGGLQVKTIANLVATVDLAVQNGVAGPAPWLTPVDWVTGLVCVATQPATAVTYLGETYVTITAHTAGGAFDSSKFRKITAKGLDGGTTLTTKGDLLVHNGTSATRLPAGAAGTVPIYNPDAARGIEGVPALMRLGRGLTWSKDGPNTIAIAAGGCLSDDGTAWIEYVGGAGLAIDTVVGTGTGTLDSGPITNADFWLFLDLDPATGIVKPVTSLSRTTPALGVGHKKRLIGWIRRSGGSLVDFWTAALFGFSVQFGWKAPSNEYSATVTTSRTLALLKVPVGIEVLAQLTYTLSDPSASANARVMYPGETDLAVPSGVPANLQGNLAGSLVARGTIEVRTSTEAKVAHRSDANATLALATNSFRWDR